MIDSIPPAIGPGRITCQIVPDTTGKTALFRSEVGLDGFERLPLIGWAVVLTVRPGSYPLLSLEPVVDDACHGSIALGDLEEEVGPLTLLEIV
ncbi:hypothetical protein ACF06W_11620 [Streptomyces albus]|uniref:hypothetical protein n=1 Tax=Streptomyces albus TaxID=1888 RepID=UPI003700B3D2